MYFADGAEDLPFIDLADWKDLLVYAYNTLDTNGDKEYGLTMEISEEGNKVVLTRETGFNMIVDFEAGTMTFMDYVAFNQPANGGYMEVSGFPKTMNGEPFILQSTKDRNLYGEVTVVNLKEYDIPMIAQDGKYLLPMQTLSAFNLSDFSTGAYFNGEGLFVNVISDMAHPREAMVSNLSSYGLLTPEAIAEYQSYEGTTEEKVEHLLDVVSEFSDKGKELAEQYRKDKEASMYVRYTSVPRAARSSALIQYGFNELALELDCFYGLKESHNIRNFRLFFLQNELSIGLDDPDAAKADQVHAGMVPWRGELFLPEYIYRRSDDPLFPGGREYGSPV